MEAQHFDRAKVTIGDEMVKTGEVDIDEEGNVFIIEERTGNKITTHLKNNVVVQELKDREVGGYISG